MNGPIIGLFRWHFPDCSVGLDQAGLSRLRDRLKALPPSERHAWAVPLKEGDLAGPGRKPWAHEYDDLGPLILDLAFKAPASGESSSRRALVVPSFGAIQAGLDARFGEDAVQLMPVFGPSTADEVLSMIGQGGRVLGLAWPDQDPPRLEGKELSRLFWTLHDVYHAYLGSLLPASYRSLFPRLAQLAREGRRRLSRHAQADGDKGLAARALLAATQPLVESLLNLDVQTAFSGWKGLGESLSQDFNLLWTAIVRDMARHPEAWPGVAAEREARAIGPMAERLLAMERRTAQEPKPSRSDDLARYLALRRGAERTEGILQALRIGSVLATIGAALA